MENKTFICKSSKNGTLTCVQAPSNARHMAKTSRYVPFERFEVEASIPFVHPNVLNVPSVDYPTIQSAIDYVKSGDDAGYVQIKIAPGTYDEFITIEGFEAYANGGAISFAAGDVNRDEEGVKGFQILGDSRPFIGANYVNGYERNGESGRSPTYTLTTSVPGIGPYQVRIATSFGGIGGVSNLGAQAALPLFAPGVAGTACVPLTNVGLTGQIAVIRRGTCGFANKTKNAQDHGAAAVIVINNTPAILSMAGSDSTITIPAYGINGTDGLVLSAAVIANPGIKITVTPNGGAYYPPLGTNFAISNLSLNSTRDQVTVTMVGPLPIADANILAPPVLDQPAFDDPSVGIVPTDYIAFSDADILGNFTRSVHQVTAVNGNQVTFDPPLADVSSGGVDVEALGSSLVFLPNVRITKSYPYADPNQLKRSLFQVRGVDVSISGLWIDQDASVPFGQQSEGLIIERARSLLANIVVSDFQGTAINGLGMYFVESNIYIEDGYRGDPASKNLVIMGWGEGLGVSSQSMIRFGSILVHGVGTVGLEVGLGSTIGIENLRIHGIANLFQADRSAFHLGSGADYGGIEVMVNGLCHITDIYGTAMDLSASNVNLSDGAFRVERIYQPVGNAIENLGAIIVRPGSRLTITSGLHNADGTVRSLIRDTSVIADTRDITDIVGNGFSKSNVGIVVYNGGEFTTEAAIDYHDNDVDYRTVLNGIYSTPNDVPSPSDVLQVIASGPLDSVFKNQSLGPAASLMTLDPSEKVGLNPIYQGKTYLIYSPNKNKHCIQLAPGASFVGHPGKVLKFHSKIGSFVRLLVVDDTSVLVEESKGVEFSFHCC